jgi:hypothetical protein
MEIIETQFRAGNITFVDQKYDEPVVEALQTQVTTMAGGEKLKHTRKKSILVTNFKTHVRHSKNNSFYILGSRSPIGPRNEVDEVGTVRKNIHNQNDDDLSNRSSNMNNEYMMNRQKYKQRRKVDGESVGQSTKSIGQSTTIMKSTTATNNHGSKTLIFIVLASDPDNTVRKVEQFIKSDTNNSEPVIKGIRFVIINIENLNIKTLQHNREEIKDELVRENTLDMLQKHSVSCEGVETQFVAGD